MSVIFGHLLHAPHHSSVGPKTPEREVVDPTLHYGYSGRLGQISIKLHKVEDEVCYKQLRFLINFLTIVPSSFAQNVL